MENFYFASVLSVILKLLLMSMSLVLVMGLCYYLVHIGNRNVNEEHRIVPTRKNIIKFVIILATVLLFAWMYYKYQVVRTILWSMFFAALISYLINPLVKIFEKWTNKRWLSITLVFVIITVLLALLIILAIPKTVEQLGNLAIQMTSKVQYLITDGIDKVQDIKWLKLDKNMSEMLIKKANDILTAIERSLPKFVTGLTLGIGSQINSIMNILLSLFLIPLFSYQFLMSKEKMQSSVMKRIPEEYKSDINEIGKRCSRVLNEFFKARGLMAVFVGICTSIVLLVMGIEFAGIIGILTMVGDIVPYIGPLFGFIPAVIFAFLSSPTKALWVIIIFMLIQWVENNVIGPILIGDSMGMNSLAVFVAILIGGAVFGVVGMILAVPIMGVIIEIFEYIIEVKKSKNSI